MIRTFSWQNFEAVFLEKILESDKTPLARKPKNKVTEAYELALYVERFIKQPDIQFIIDYRTEIEFYFLKNNPNIVISVFGKKGKENPNSILREISKMEMGEILATKYIKALKKIGCNDMNYEISDFVKPVTINLVKQEIVNVPLHDYQEEAVKNLNEFVNKGTHKSGLLVMPTGSGKTRTAVYFLLKDMISKGYQVVWLAHRHMLIDQAAEQFKNFSGIIKLENPLAKDFKFMCASGEHGTIKAASKKQDVMILSVPTATRNLDYLKTALRDKVIIVVDEAHHTNSISYKRIISAIRKKRKDAFLIGLTATPVRYTELSTSKLYEIYENNFIYSVDMNSLIKKGILSTPNYKKVETDIDFEQEITKEEAKKILKNNDLPPSVLNKIAQSKIRNQMIIDEYFKVDYGKTLIFALNIIHAQMLCDELKKRKVRCACVYSGKENNNEIINAFSEGTYDVLINVNILTEGSDVPKIETVFLTRPTQSEALLVQICGRGMRGESVGGTPTVNLVDFVDKWDVFSKWLTPKFVIEGIDGEETENKEANKKEVYQIPWKDIRAIYRLLGSPTGHINEWQSIPLGWYTLNDEGVPYTLLVFENQLEGYEKIIKNKEEIINTKNLSIEKIIDDYFLDMIEKPTLRNIEIFINTLKEDEEVPYFYYLKDREQVEPYTIAKRIKENNENIFEVCNYIHENNKEMVEELFGTIEEYRKRIFEIINYNDNSNDIKIEEMPIELIDYKLDCPYDSNDLNDLYNDTKEEMKEYLGECYNDTGTVTWTKKPLTSIYGRYIPNGNIEINLLLNSSKVDKETIKYLLYHEMLHRKYKYHNKEFKTLEHKYPDYTKHEKFLDVDFNGFRFEY